MPDRCRCNGCDPPWIEKNPIYLGGGECVDLAQNSLHPRLALLLGNSAEVNAKHYSPFVGEGAVSMLADDLPAGVK